MADAGRQLHVTRLHLVAVHERGDRERVRVIGSAGRDEDQRLLVGIGAIAVPPGALERPRAERGRPGVGRGERIPAGGVDPLERTADGPKEARRSPRFEIGGRRTRGHADDVVGGHGRSIHPLAETVAGATRLRRSGWRLGLAAHVEGGHPGHGDGTTDYPDAVGLATDSGGWPVAPADSLARLRKALMDRAERKEAPVTQLCQQAGVSRSRFYELRARYRQYGEAGLRPKPRPVERPDRRLPDRCGTRSSPMPSSTRPTAPGRSPSSSPRRGSAAGE